MSVNSFALLVTEINSFHGKKLLSVIASNSFAKDHLVESLEREFLNTEFYTCSKEHLSVRELIDFFIGAKVIVFKEGVARVNHCDSCSTE